MKRANEEHHQILELCRNREIPGACKLLRQHIRFAGESLKQALELKRSSVKDNSKNGDSGTES